jgi:4-hydroxy-3-methylbut-2-enyl diphosphate reductase
MKIITASINGFCFGVKRAVRLAEDASRKGEVFSLGPIIHNKSVIQHLARKGVRIVKDLRGIHKGELLLIRSHGIHPAILYKAKRKGIRIIDATCPFVRRCQRLARALIKEGYRVIVFGDKNHSEVKSIVGFTNDMAKVVESIKDVALATRGAKKIGLLSQTTQSKDAFKEIVAGVVELVPEVRIFNTLCQAATERQEEARRISKKVDLAIIVGGKNSANTMRLARIMREAKVKTLHIEDIEGLKKFRLNGYKRVAVTSGASTPREVTKEVIDYLKRMK